MATMVWLLRFAVWILLIGSSYRLGLISRYRLIFTYIFSLIGLELLGAFVHSRFGLQSQVYFHFFTISTGIGLTIASAVLLQIYQFIAPIRWARDWHLLVVPMAICGLVLSDSRPMAFNVRLLNIGYCVVTYLGLVTSARMVFNRDVDIGWNLKMVLLAISVPASLNSVVFVFFISGFAVSYETLAFWMQAVWVAAWIILAVGMLEYSPPRTLIGPLRDEPNRSDKSTPRADVDNRLERHAHALHR